MTDYKKNEQRVLELLNLFKGSSFKMATGKYNEFDIFGTIDGKPTIVECKERSKLWNKMWIEKSKLESMFRRSKEAAGRVNVYLVISHDDNHYLYDAKDIWVNGVNRNEKMNAQTAFKNTNKVSKDVIEFNKNDYIIELKTQELGYKYEVIAD